MAKEKDEMQEIKALIEEAKKTAAEIIGKAQEAAEEIKKNAQKGAKAEDEKIDPLNELVEVELFKDGNEYKDDVFVSVNDETCQIRRGVKVKIKKKFALVLDEAERQKKAKDALIEKETNKYREEAKIYG